MIYNLRFDRILKLKLTCVDWISSIFPSILLIISLFEKSPQRFIKNKEHKLSIFTNPVFIFLEYASCIYMSCFFMSFLREHYISKLASIQNCFNEESKFYIHCLIQLLYPHHLGNGKRWDRMLQAIGLSKKYIKS